jgi:MFS family permease
MSTVEPSRALQAGTWAGRGPRLTLFVLCLVYMCNTIDRNVLSVLFEPIKAEFALSDGQLGWLATGFGLSYALSGLVFGIAADRKNRRNIIAGCLTLWSAMTAVCGLAQTFAQLLVARLGVGIGEAGASPAAMSIISDLYPAGRRATAMSFYYLSTSIGFMIALALGGMVESRFGWRATFLIAALPGAFLIPILLLAVREPPRGGAESAGAADEMPSIRTFALFVIGQPALLLLVLGSTINVMALSGVGAWTVSYFVRVHGVTIATAGAYIGGLQGAMGIVGTLCGGVLADFLGRRDVRARLWLVAAATLIGLLCTLGWIFSSTFWLAAAFFGATAFANSIWYGPVYSLAQGLVRVRMRATMAAMIYLITNLGAGIGPGLIGYLSDHFAPSNGGNGLALALMSVASVNVFAAATFVIAARTLSRDLLKANG